VSHTVVLSTVGRVSGFSALCSCGAVLLEESVATLDELTKIAHEHIETAERSEGYGGRPVLRQEAFDPMSDMLALRDSTHD
jgi:hypothetical protein